MLFPFRTDAPIYHWPVATVGIIVVNFVSLVLCLQHEPEWCIPATLEYGNGLHPLQWFTSLFVHAGILHFLANMIWLWAFGLIIEGKLGWWKFLLVYLGIGATESAISQTLMLGGSESYALGASGAVFGILAIALIWAPKNEVSCFYMIFMVPHVFEAPVLGLASGYLLLQVVFAVLNGFTASGALSHVIGGVLGLGVGVALLYKRQVDCEGWDLFSIWNDKHIRLPSEIGRHDERSPSHTEEPDDSESGRISQAAAQTQIHQILSDDKPLLALAAHRRLSRSEAGWQLAPEVHMRLISGLCTHAEWKAAVETMQEYLKAHLRKSQVVRLKLAEVLLKRLERPTAALKVLGGIEPGELSPEQEAIRNRLTLLAQQLREEGVIEMESDEF